LAIAGKTPGKDGPEEKKVIDVHDLDKSNDRSISGLSDLKHMPTAPPKLEKY
jgi:hypothetical protein